MEIKIKDAVASALKYMRELYEGQDIQDLMLEEVAREGDFWYITISFTRPAPARAVALQDMFKTVTGERVYKVVEINAISLNAMSMTSIKAGSL